MAVREEWEQAAPVRRITARLSDPAHRAIERACRGGGITITALFEAIGLELDRNPGALGDRGPDILEAARRIDYERRNRGLGPGP